MDTKPKLPSSSREMRNIAEKMRRDKLNNYVTELASIVPLVCGSSKRIDKTSVLRLAANYIRMHNILHDAEDKETTAVTPAPVHKAHLNMLEEVIGGFLLIMTSSGKVVFITESVESLFGHTQVDLLGNSIYNIIHPEDHDILKEQLDIKDESRRSFFCRMTEKVLSRNDPNRYEIIHIVGTLKPLPESFPSSVTPSVSKYQSESTDNNNSDSDSEDTQSTHSSNKIGTHMLVSFVRVVKDRPITELSLVESTQDEYITRHTMDGKILYTDHRISFVTGLMPGEVVGTSAFQYMHPEDMVWSMVATKLMFTSTQGQGLVSYRLKCRGGTLVTLRSRGYIELNKQTGQAETFVCINTVVSVKEAKGEIKNQRRKLLPMIVCQQSEDHLGSVSSTMPPELMSMMKQLMDPKSLQKMIAEVDPTLKMASTFGPHVPQNADSVESLESEDVHQECNSSVQPSVNLINSYPNVESNKVEDTQSINKPRKRNSTEECCTLPAKIPNQNRTCKPKADVYHQSYSPQHIVPLPNLSPDTVQPLLCPSPSQLPQEKLSFTHDNIFSDKTTHMLQEEETKADTNIMHYHHDDHKLEGIEIRCHQPTGTNNILSNGSYQDCRQCNKTSSDSCRYFMSHDHLHSSRCHHQSARNVKSADGYYNQSASENINASKYPLTVTHQDQIYPPYIGSTNGLNYNNRNDLIQAHQNISYSPHTYSNSYQANHICYSSVPEFDNKLQRHYQQEDKHLQLNPHLRQQNHLPQQRVHVQQHCSSNSSISQSCAMGINYEVTNSETFCNIPNQCVAPTTENQGTVCNLYGPSPESLTYEKKMFHSYGAKLNRKISEPYSGQHF